jgi:hypothetical protein
MVWPIVILSALLSACAGTYDVVRMPEREADLYPLAQTEVGVTIAIDEIKDGARARRYFGANLLKFGVLPVALIISNYGKDRLAIKPSDVLLHRGAEIIDPLPVEVIAGIAKRERWFLRSKTEKQIDSFFEDLLFNETVLMPNETYQGVLFFSSPQPSRTKDSYFTVLSLFREGGPKVRVGATNLDTRERLHFGPFTLSSEHRQLGF